MRAPINPHHMYERPVRSWTSRQYESERDLIHMQELLMEGRARTDDWHYPHIGDLVFWFFMVACHLNPQEFIHLWHAANGKLIAYAILGEDPTFDYQVSPDFEWRGIELEALAWVEMRLVALRQHDAQRWGGKLVAGGRQDNVRWTAFLEENGFIHTGSFDEVNMICSLDGHIPEAMVPEGYQLRAFAGEAEISSRAGAQRDVWQPWTVGNVSDEDYALFIRLPGYDSQLDVVSVAPDGEIAAYVNGWIDPLNRIGDFGPVGARPAYRRRGLTKAVLLECLQRMQKMGMNRVSVSTNVTNEPAIRLYESVGFKIVNRFLEYTRES